ncbi:hypothetical protein [Sulfobacillus thermosulfidooxidans]|uniref:hypothetical protein n=1 Tax=Sulfobacillus thermosulfidooxidans TaxID=28034 RepID=UPI0002F29284|nr:hypothetical protein [Sulfobacillus thermosulfidooxidans]
MARESRFKRLAMKIAGEYRRKGYSPSEALKIGRETAADIGFRKYGKRRMERMAHRAERRRRKHR